MKTESRYLQVKNYILKGIGNHQWLAGERVPSENELVKSCSVSRMTARRAVKELTAEGVLFSRQGQGTFVATAKSRSSVMTLRNIADEIHERNNEHQCEIVTLKIITKQCISDLVNSNQESDLMLNFIAECNGEIYFSRMIHFENNVPIQLEERFVNPALADDYLEQDFTLFTANEYLMKVCPVSEAEHKVEAVMPTAQQRTWLKMPKAIPSLKVSRTTWSGNKIASFAWLYHPGNKFHLGNHIKLREED